MNNFTKFLSVAGAIIGLSAIEGTIVYNEEIERQRREAAFQEKLKNASGGEILLHGLAAGLEESCYKMKQQQDAQKRQETYESLFSLLME